MASVTRHIPNQKRDGKKGNNNDKQRRKNKHKTNKLTFNLKAPALGFIMTASASFCFERRSAFFDWGH
jgi:hypothetical protein